MKLAARALSLLALAPLAGANQVTLTPATVHSVTPFPGFEFVGACNLQVGFNTAFDITHDGLVRFDVAGAIPPGSRVNAVQLSLTAGLVPFPDFPVHVRRIGAPWTGCTETWTCCAASAVSSATSPMTANTVFATTVALVADVQGWVDQPATNHGWRLIEPIYFGEGYWSAANVFLAIDFDPPCAPATSFCVAAPNAAGPGAFLSASGSTRISDHDFTLVVTGCNPSSPGFFFFGAGQQQTPWGNGFLCVDAPFFRLLPAVFADGQGVATRPVDFTVGSAQVITPGSTWHFQFKYRDIVPGGAGFNASDGLSATFCP